MAASSTRKTHRRRIRCIVCTVGNMSNMATLLERRAAVTLTNGVITGSIESGGRSNVLTAEGAGVRAMKQLTTFRFEGGKREG